MTIEIFLTREYFKTTYLHQDIETGNYYLFLNTKLNSRKLKKIEKKIKEYLSSTKIKFLINNNYKDIKINN